MKPKQMPGLKLLWYLSKQVTYRLLSVDQTTMLLDKLPLMDDQYCLHILFASN